MKRVALSLVALIAIAGAGSLSAQGTRFGIGGGLLMPLSDYKNADKMGFLVGADATMWLQGAPVGIRIEGDFSQTSHKNGVGGHTTLYGGLAELVYAFGPKVSPVRPYILGGVGYMHGKVEVTGLGSASESKAVFGAGGGLAFKMGTGGTRFFVEARWQSFQTSPSLKMIPIRAGFRF
jgi:opacity protein-like surface antigen